MRNENATGDALRLYQAVLSHLRSSLILAAPDGQRLCKVGEIRLVARETRCFHNVTCTGQHFCPVHVALGRPTDSLEQWQVVSNEPTSIETFTEYGERFQIEEGFLDDKSDLFALESSRIQDAAGLERLTLTLSVATPLYGFAPITGNVKTPSYSLPSPPNRTFSTRSARLNSRSSTQFGITRF